MSLSLVSFNYKHTPLALREKLDISPGRLPSLLNEVRGACGLGELMILSTCNRVEFYFSEPDRKQAAQSIMAWMKSGFDGWEEELERCGVILHDQDAVTHLFRVACSLESMVIGEPQILGQVKESYQMARDNRTIGPYLTALMRKVFQTAKRVRTETGIARYPVSVSYMAVELARRIFERLDDKTVMVIGAGEMAELVVAHLKRQGVRKLLITNRTFANGVALAEKVQGSAVRFEQMADHLADADIVISSTGAQGYVVDREMARKATKSRKGNPIFFIDIAVPRDISPDVGGLSDVYAYDIDDLQSAASANLKERESEATKAQVIIEEELATFQRDSHARRADPVIRALRQQFTETSQQEVEKSLKRFKHFSEADRDAMRGVMRNVMNKLLHLPSTRLKEMEIEQNDHHFTETLVSLFGLELEARAASTVSNTSGQTMDPAATGSAAAEGFTGEQIPGENVLRLRIPGKP